jgi:hypothetical protein
MTKRFKKFDKLKTKIDKQKFMKLKPVFDIDETFET